MTEKLFQVSDCDNLSNKQVRDLYKKFVNPSLEQLFGAFGIGDQEIDYFYENHYLASAGKKKPKQKSKKISANTKKSSTESSETLNVSVRLATFTLVNVLKNQALFYQALEVLDLLEQKGEDPDMIRLERDAVKELIITSEKEKK